MIKKYLFVTIFCLVIFSPFLYILCNAEYDGEQIFLNQSFENEKYEIISTKNNLIVYEVLVKEDNWTGFDIPSLGDMNEGSIVTILDEEKESVRIGKITHNPLVNDEQIINVRFRKISDSKDKHYFIIFTRDNDNNWNLQYSYKDIYEPNETFINGKKVEGDLNIVNVYRTNIAGILGVLGDRFLYYLKT